MTTGTKIALACVLAGVVLSAIAGDISGIAWALAAGFWIWQHDLMRQQRDDLAAGHTLRPGEYRVEVRPEQFQKLLTQINQFDHQPTSVGGTRPHMCKCGTPISDHKGEQ